MENKLDGLFAEFRIVCCGLSGGIEVESPETIDPKDVAEKNLNAKDGVEVIKSISTYKGKGGYGREYSVITGCRWSLCDEMDSYFLFDVETRVFIKTLPKSSRAPKEHRIGWHVLSH